MLSYGKVAGSEGISLDMNRDIVVMAQLDGVRGEVVAS